MYIFGFNLPIFFLVLLLLQAFWKEAFFSRSLKLSSFISYRV